jgi:endonuclease YncB( thermonuclease family)
LDGDTLEIRTADGVERIRLLGINTPEKHECMGPEARQALTDLVAHGIRIERSGTDRTGRTLAHLFLGDDTHVQLSLVSAGLALAVPYGRRDVHTSKLERALADARHRRLGMFAEDACGNPDPQLNSIRIVELDANPPGKDLSEGAGESVLLSGPPNLSLAGLVLKDTSASHRYRFPTGATLDQSGQMRVYTSCGEPGEGTLFWCRKGSAVWNNSGDTAYLLAPGGRIVSWLDYSQP